MAAIAIGVVAVVAYTMRPREVAAPPDKIQQTDPSATIETTRGDAIQMKGDKLTGFSIAGADQKFVPAEAEITGPYTVSVSVASVASPEAVRFGWSNFPQVNLFNRAGLPATPFRTDTWPLLTQPKTSGAK